jgi:hypothetical protein
MWAQLIKVRLKPGKDLAVAAAQLRAAEQPGSDLVREMFMHDQKDPDQADPHAARLALQSADEPAESARAVRGSVSLVRLTQIC